jgi:6-phosphogluconate dehydrogenase
MSESQGGVSKNTAQIGVTGLAVMGRNLARNLARHGYRVALHNRTAERTKSLVAEHGHEGTFLPSESMQDFVASLRRPRAIIIMVKAGQPTDAVIDELVPLLDHGDIVIDCGNAHYTDTRRRERDLRARGIHFVGSGCTGRASCRAARLSRTARSGRCSSRSPRTWKGRRAACTSALTVPAIL